MHTNHNSERRTALLDAGLLADSVDTWGGV
jgi:hypothetical protein